MAIKICLQLDFKEEAFGMLYCMNVFSTVSGSDLMEKVEHWAWFLDKGPSVSASLGFVFYSHMVRSPF